MNSVPLSQLTPRSYQREVANLEHSVEIVKSQIQRLIDTFKQYSNTGLLRDGAILSDTISEFGSQNLGSHEFEVINIGETVKFIENSRRHLLESIQVIFVSPLEEFLRNDINEVHTMKQLLEESKEEYSQSKLRFDIARTSGKSTSKLQKDLEEATKTYKVAEITYANKLIDIMARKEFELVEKLCTYMFAQANYFHEGYEALSKLEPTLRATVNLLVNYQNDYLDSKHLFRIEDIMNKYGEPPQEVQIKQGFIFLKKKVSWIRRYLLITDGYFYLFKGWKEVGPIHKINLSHCQVKVYTSERNHCLQVISPEHNLIFQTNGPDDMIEWKQIIEYYISFKRSVPSLSSPSKSNIKQMLIDLNPMNGYCADCDAEDVDWMIISLGMMICNRCSEIHRSIGVHISKLRQLTSSYSFELIQIAKLVGNEKGNNVFEYSLNPSEKPNPSSPRDEKAEFIRSKYEFKKYVEKPVVSTQQLQFDLVDRCTEGDAQSVIRLISQGVDVNFYVNADRQISLFHHLTIDGKATTVTIELLLQNGANPSTVDSLGRTALHYAAMADRVTYARIFLLRGVSENLEDHNNQTALSIASSLSNSKVMKYLSKSLSDEDLEGLQPADMESLQIVQSNFVAGIDLIQTKLDLFKQQLKGAENIEDTMEIMKKIRAIKLAISDD